MVFHKYGKSTPGVSNDSTFYENETLTNDLELSPYQSVDIYETVNKQPEFQIIRVNPVSRTRRFFNFILDSAFWGLFWFLFEVFLMAMGLDAYRAKINNGVFAMGMLIIYFVFFESVYGRTPAKALTKTKVIKSDGSKPDFLSILGRTLSRFIPFEGFTFLGSKNPVGLHDSLSGTVVVMADEIGILDNKKKYS